MKIKSVKEQRKVKGFFGVRKDIFECLEFSGPDMMTYFSLLRYMNNGSKECFPSIKTLCKSARIGKDTLYKSLDRLERAGLVRRKQNKGRVNHYVMLNPKKLPLPDSL